MKFVNISLSLLTLITLVNDSWAQSFRVTLLGTGCPRPVMERFGPSILIEAGDQKLIFDTGRGALQRLHQVRVSFKDIDAVFLTHLHSDHIVGLPDLWLTGWVADRRERPLLLFGPQGTGKMMTHLEQAFEFDIRIRIFDDKAPAAGVVVRARDVTEGLIYNQNGVRVTVFDVDHAPITPAFGYRVDYSGRSVVISGDTKLSENLVKYARGSDLLIHEVVSEESVRRLGRPDDWVRTIVGHHTTPAQAGEIFQRTKPKLAVYSHIVLPNADEKTLITETRRTYNGPLEVGQDLMSFEIGKQVSVKRP